MNPTGTIPPDVTGKTVLTLVYTNDVHGDIDSLTVKFTDGTALCLTPAGAYGYDAWLEIEAEVSGR